MIGKVKMEGGMSEQFPVGMRVLAVDDNPTCLRTLEELLLRCKYHVTTAKDAKTALEMLRERRNEFDLVITDVEMPHMDGFKLLELVGLEMDLPVIMLSAHSDYDHVMKGITHGACDYLLKPVHLKDLRIIWQHVIRKNTKSYPPGISKLNKKRKDHHDLPAAGKDHGDYHDEGEDQGAEGSQHDLEDSSTQKKPRVVWSFDLHEKFVNAVQQLGPEKAVPKKILDLMNVEGLTRENVASHLQKYRLYLKKVDEAKQQNNMAAAAFGTKDPSYFLMEQLDGLRDFRSLTPTRQLPSSTPLSHHHAGMLTGLNSPTALSTNLQGITSSSFIQPGYYQNISNSTNPFGKYQSTLSSGAQNAILFRRTLPSVEPSRFPESKCPAYVRDFNRLGDRAAAFTMGGSFPDSGATFGSSSSSVSRASTSSLMLQANYQQPPQRFPIGNHSSLLAAPSSSGSLDLGAHGSSSFPSLNRCNDSWQGNAKMSRFPLSSLSLNHPFSQDQVPTNNNLGGSAGSSLVDLISSVSAVNPGGETQCQTDLLGDIVRDMNTSGGQQWEENGRDYNHLLNYSLSNMDYLVPTSNMAMDHRNAARSKASDVSPVSQVGGSATFNTQRADVDRAATVEHLQMVSDKDCALEQAKSEIDFIHNPDDTLDDMMNEMMKQDENGMVSMAAGFGFDAFPPPLGSRP